MKLTSTRSTWPGPFSFYGFLLISLTIFFYFFDLGNLNGIRQGTEALYLKISQEMFATNNFLTPMYQGSPHWSKPPVPFWLPFPFYYFGAGTSTFLSRLAIACCGLGGIAVWGWHLHRYGKVPFLLTFTIFAGSLGFLKFSRTFMMEIPLAIFPSIGLLFFYHYLQRRSRLNLLLGVTFFGLGILVKGPVSWLMGASGLGSFALWVQWRRGEILWRPIMLFLGISLLIGGSWFAAVSFVHGSATLNYFFLRENLGKFYAHPYPASVLVEGLLLYSFPWCCFLPLLWQGHQAAKTSSNSVQLSSLYAFLFCNFLCFYLPWFLPNQKSHHYALPAMPFFLGLIALAVQQITGQRGTLPVASLGPRLVQMLLLLVQGICLFAMGLLLAVNSNEILLPAIAILLILALGSFLLWQQRPFAQWGPLLNFALMGIWCLILPAFYLPEVPIAVEKLITPQVQLATVKRRSYFTEQSLGRSVVAISPLEINLYLQQNYRIIIPETILTSFHQAPATPQVAILATWPKWRKKIGGQLIMAALRTRSLQPLQENVYLIGFRGNDDPKKDKAGENTPL